VLVPEIYCSNLETTKKFYIDLFGFDIKYERPEEKFAYFTLNGSDSRKWLNADLVRPYGRGVNFQWDVLEIDRLFDRVKVASPQSIFLETETKSYRCGGEFITQKQFIAEDPDGYLFRFCSEV